MVGTGSLERLKIIGYGNKNRSQRLGMFIAPINPASISLAYGIETAEKGNSNKELDFAGYKPPSLSFDLILDGTGVKTQVEGMPLQIPEMVELFKSTCYYYIGGKHDVPYVVVQWGAAIMTYKFKLFAGRLTSLKIDYTLFNPSGIPIRAKLSASFEGTMSISDGKTIDQLRSPDLTHRVKIRAGDSLPNLCKEIYGDPNFYHQIACINKLVNFRYLEPGVELEFPPLK